MIEVYYLVFVLFTTRATHVAIDMTQLGPFATESQCLSAASKLRAEIETYIKRGSWGCYKGVMKE